MTIEQKLKRAALHTVARHSLRPPVQNPKRTARNLTEFAETLAGLLAPADKDALQSALEKALASGVDPAQVELLLAQAIGLR